jgi:cytochrome c oxidase cbb3-type subunit 2
VRRDLDADEATALVASAPQVIFPEARAMQVQEVTKLLTNAGARIESRVANLGPDLRRGWGNRRTVSRDYLRDRPVMLGHVRFGPDLANIGVRLPDPARLLRKLYNARIDMPGSTMPRYAYLFEERKLSPGQPASPDALELPAEFAPPAGTEIVPKREARQLVAYLLSLQSEQMFYEVFPPQAAKTNAVAASTGATNVPAAPLTNVPAATNAPTSP